MGFAEELLLSLLVVIKKIASLKYKMSLVNLHFIINYFLKSHHECFFKAATKSFFPSIFNISFTGSLFVKKGTSLIPEAKVNIFKDHVWSDQTS